MMAGKPVSKRLSGIALYILVAKPLTSFRFLNQRFPGSVFIRKEGVAYPTG